MESKKVEDEVLDAFFITSEEYEKVDLHNPEKRKEVWYSMEMTLRKHGYEEKLIQRLKREYWKQWLKGEV